LFELAGAPAGDVEILVVEREIDVGDERRHGLEAFEERRQLRWIGRNRWDGAPEQAWFVGDNLEWDVAAPQNLGMCAVWIDTARAGLPSGTTVRPDRIIHALGELGW
jgi:putative hydrolase of the HAD superfamily